MRRGWMMLSFLGLLAVSSAGAAPTGVLHDPVGRSQSGEAVPIAVELPGAQAGEARVTLYYREHGRREFAAFALAEREAGSFHGAIPAVQARGVALFYYIEAAAPGSGFRMAVGSAARPFEIELTPAAAASASGGGLTWAIGGASALLVLAAVIVAGARRRRRGDTIEKVFWARLLYPLTRAASFDAAEKLRKLARTPLDHPRKGLTMFSYHQLVRRLAEVKEMDMAELRRERDLLAREVPGVPDLPDHEPAASAAPAGAAPAVSSAASIGSSLAPAGASAATAAASTAAAATSGASPAAKSAAGKARANAGEVTRSRVAVAAR